ncbi:hypothetical protein VTL71DRAFT_6761 [Oculimacula yallundae]|uniref:C2H2-type domain-containing protein n=1 Tax=Oculimacula yallundae TaxID=86028 RepID=A0ABR4BY10_9HELO
MIRANQRSHSEKAANDGLEDKEDADSAVERPAESLTPARYDSTQGFEEHDDPNNEEDKISGSDDEDEVALADSERSHEESAKQDSENESSADSDDDEDPADSTASNVNAGENVQEENDCEAGEEEEAESLAVTHITISSSSDYEAPPAKKARNSTQPKKSSKVALPPVPFQPGPSGSSLPNASLTSTNFRIGSRGKVQREFPHCLRRRDLDLSQSNIATLVGFSFSSHLVSVKLKLENKQLTKGIQFFAHIQSTSNPKRTISTHTSLWFQAVAKSLSKVNNKFSCSASKCPWLSKVPIKFYKPGIFLIPSVFYNSAQPLQASADEGRINYAQPANLRWRPYYVDPPLNQDIAEWYDEMVALHAGNEVLIAAGGNGYEQEDPRDDLCRYRNGVNEGPEDEAGDRVEGAGYSAIGSAEEDEDNSEYSDGRDSLDSEYDERHQQAPHIDPPCKTHQSELFSEQTRYTSSPISSGVSASGRPKHQCPHCQKMFGTLKRHVDSVHLRFKKNFCGSCGIGFAEKNKMKKHEAICKKKRDRGNKRKRKADSEDDVEDGSDGYEGDYYDDGFGGDYKEGPDDDERGPGGAGGMGREGVRQLVRA